MAIFVISCGCIPDSKVHGANIGPIWVLSAPEGPHVGPMNLAIRKFSVPKTHYEISFTFASSGTSLLLYKYMVDPLYNIHVRQVSSYLSWGDAYHIWMWYLFGKECVDNSAKWKWSKKSWFNNAAPDYLWLCHLWIKYDECYNYLSVSVMSQGVLWGQRLNLLTLRNSDNYFHIVFNALSCLRARALLPEVYFNSVAEKFILN